MLYFYLGLRFQCPIKLVVFLQCYVVLDRKSVLKHHPDKRRRKGENISDDVDDDYFTCITKAWEILGNATTRRSYDSIDPTFDDDIPSKTLKYVSLITITTR